MIEFKKKVVLTDNISFRLHPHEKELLKEMADNLGIPLSDYCRTVLIHYASENHKKLHSENVEV